MVVRLSRRGGDEEEGVALATNGFSKPSSSNAGGSGYVTVWKTTTFLLAFLLILIVTETIEVKRPAKKEDNQVTLGGSVEFKSSPSESIVEEEPSVTSPPPTDAPVSLPPPTDPPVPVPTDSPVPAPTDPPQPSPTDAPIPPDDTHITAATQPADLTAAIATERHTYRRRGQPMTEQAKEAMMEQWGEWTLVDDKERPTTDYYARYPNRDIPRSAFPPNAWQTDTEYLAKFLPEAIGLVERTQEAILAEYGKTEGTFEERAEMFEIEMFDKGSLEKTGGAVISRPEWRKDTTGDRGGWSTYKSMDGLKRRLLHAVMTEDSFIFAMGGHSAAAGHGNLFYQSYTTQVQWILEAVFARLGVRHQAKNFANGGLGTMQHGLAASSVYGPAIDMLMWDSGMTEKEAHALEVFARQAIIGGVKVPVIWGLLSDQAKDLSLYVDADVGVAGRGTFGVAKAETIEELEALPWAAKYLKCGGDIEQICKDNKYLGHCWDDQSHPGVEPPTKQQDVPGGRAGWHPGNRTHQLQGRVLAFTILQSLKEALKEWNEAENYAIADDKWHVTAWYDNIRSNLEKYDGHCKDLATFELDWTCKYPVKARTEFTPRAYPSLSNIRTLMAPEMVSTIPQPERPIYEPPEVFNQDLHPPAGAVDVLNIVEAGVDFRSTLNPDYATNYYKKPKFAAPNKMPYGKGVGIDQRAGDNYCDGSVDSFCGKGPKDTCLLAGTNDERSGLMIDGYSGWTVLNLPDVKYGYVAIKFESWHQKNSNTLTDGWTSENNENNESNSRHLKGPAAEPYCDDFRFETAIDGKVTSWNYEEFSKRNHVAQRVLEVATVLQDENYTGGEEKEVEFAFRLTGCGRDKTFKISHVYWA
jgi:hypothetical protein